MEDFSSEENKKRRLEDDLIVRKSLLRGQTGKIARDNIKLRQNLRELAKNFLRKGGSEDTQASDQNPPA